MIYNSGRFENENWIIEEGHFNPEYLGKCESVMCQGNGYLGLRAAMEETVKFDYSRFMFVAGTFDKPDDAATEIANCPDITNMYFKINGQDMRPTPENVTEYSRSLNLKDGILSRVFTWTGEGVSARFFFTRMVSLADFHLIYSEVSVACDDDCEIEVRSGVDGCDIPASDHLVPVSQSAECGMMHVMTKTHESEILMSVASSVDFLIDEEAVYPEKAYEISDKRVYQTVKISLPASSLLTVVKTSSVFTNRDKNIDLCDAKTLGEYNLTHLALARRTPGYIHMERSACEWNERIWRERGISITGDGADRDQLALRFAIYHLTVMSPVHDNRMNIGAKGLSGPGYKGHSFWDTEVFMLPYFIFAAPKEARSLLEHRYNSLEAARENAKSRGYDGAMYPWESAWITDGEVTPSWANTGLMEHHITADVAFGVYYYYIVTGDADFMEKCGYEIIFSTAKFWLSRLDYNKELDRYEILDVIGPDEYKEHVNNNAFTNYFAHWNIECAVNYAKSLEKTPLYERLDKALGLSGVVGKWESALSKIYLPRENADGLVPQDDTYLSLYDITGFHPELSVSEWREEAHRLAGERGYYETMISKQADVMVLFYLMEDLFSADIKKKNFYFYEKRCFHDSSLSLSTYSALSADLGERDMAYRLFERATMIDLGDYMASSDMGIHAASLGGIWQCAVLGFMGVRRYSSELRVQPNLPDAWDSAEASIYWRQKKLHLSITHDTLTIENLTDDDSVSFLCGGIKHEFTGSITLKYKESDKRQ